MAEWRWDKSENLFVPRTGLGASETLHPARTLLPGDLALDERGSLGMFEKWEDTLAVGVLLKTPVMERWEARRWCALEITIWDWAEMRPPNTTKPWRCLTTPYLTLRPHIPEGWPCELTYNPPWEIKAFREWFESLEPSMKDRREAARG